MVIEDSRGFTWPIRKGVIKGFLGGVRTNNRGHFLFSGWAADNQKPGAARRVMIFHGRTLVADIVPTIERPYVAEKVGRDYLYSGFVVRAPRSFFRPNSVEPLRVFALTSGGVAGELRYTRNAREGAARLPEISFLGNAAGR